MILRLIEAVGRVPRDQHHADIGQELRQPDIGETHGIMGRRVNIPADRDVQHLRRQCSGGANGDEAAETRSLTQQLQQRKPG